MLTEGGIEELVDELVELLLLLFVKLLLFGVGCLDRGAWLED